MKKMAKCCTCTSSSKVERVLLMHQSETLPFLRGSTLCLSLWLGDSPQATLGLPYLGVDLPPSIGICSSKGVIKTKLQGCVGYDFHQGHTEPAIKTPDALLLHYPTYCLCNVVINLQNQAKSLQMCAHKVTILQGWRYAKVDRTENVCKTSPQKSTLCMDSARKCVEQEQALQTVLLQREALICLPNWLLPSSELRDPPCKKSQQVEMAVPRRGCNPSFQNRCVLVESRTALLCRDIKQVTDLGLTLGSESGTQQVKGIGSQCGC